MSIASMCLYIMSYECFFFIYRYLVELQATLQGEYITFLCPHRVSAVECKRSFLDVVAYVKQALVSELKKEHQAHLILVPYNEEYELVHSKFSCFMFGVILVLECNHLLCFM